MAIKNIDFKIDMKSYLVKYEANKTVDQKVTISILNIIERDGLEIDFPPINIWIDRINIGRSNTPVFFDHPHWKILEEAIGHVFYKERQRPINLASYHPLANKKVIR